MSPQIVAERAAVIAEARSWIRTPWVHRGRVKGLRGAVDCAQLLYMTYFTCALIPEMPLTDYPVDFMLHSGIERFMGAVAEHGHEVAEPQPGDVVLYRVGRVFAHGGIVTAWPMIVHANAKSRMVIEDFGDRGPLGARPHVFFTLNRWGR